MTIRVVVAAACLYVALFGVPSSLPVPSVSRPSVEKPSVALQELVSPVADICERMDAFDRLVWMSTWQEAAEAISGESDAVEVTFENTLGLRLFTSSVFDVAWRRLAKAKSYKGLGPALEEVLQVVIGNEVKPWSDDLQTKTVELYEALAWAGARGE